MRVCLLVGLVVVGAVALGAHPSAAQSTPSTISAAAKASPELVSELSKELGSTPDQAAGAAGSLFGFAKSQLKPEEFSKVAAAVPGMASLLHAAPKTGKNSLSAMAGSAAGLASLAGSFQKLGLKPEMVAQAVPILTSFVTKSGGTDVGQLLSSVLK